MAAYLVPVEALGRLPERVPLLVEAVFGGGWAGPSRAG